MPTGPKCNSHPRGGQQNAAPFHRGVRANKVRTEPSVARLGPNQKFSSGDQRERIDESLSPSFAPLGLLPLERGDQQKQSNQNPERVDPISRRGEVNAFVVTSTPQRTNGPRRAAPSD